MAGQRLRAFVALVAIAGLGAVVAPSRAQQAASGELVVSDAPDAGFHDPAVAVGADGSFFLTWEQHGVFASQVSARRYDSAAIPATAAYKVEEGDDALDTENHPTVVAKSRADEVRIAWNSFSFLESRHRVVARPFSATGQALHPQLLVEGDGSAYYPTVATSGVDLWLLTWISSRESGYGSDAYAQVFSGEVPVASSVKLNTSSSGDYEAYGAAMDPLGNGVVLWWSDPNGDLDGDLWLQRMGPDGTKAGSAQRVALEGAQYQWACDVGMDSQGRIVVAWEQGDPVDQGGANVYARRFAPDGSPLGDPFLVSTETAGAQWDCDLAMNREGDFVVTWQHNLGTAEASEDLYVRAFQADGTPYGPPVRVDEPRPPENPWAARRPAVSLNDAGVFVVAGEGGPNNTSGEMINARKFVLPCVGSATSLCLGEGRFRAHADWWIGASASGDARAVPLRDLTGGYWFFAEDNFELLLKVLEGCATNGHHWIYAAGLTDVEVHLAIADTSTGEIWSRANPWQQPFAPLQDIEALGGCGAAESSASALAAGSAPRSPPGATVTGLDGTCTSTLAHLCLQNGRFRVAASWEAFDGSSDDAFAAPLSDDSGLFWFFGPENLELAVKVIDACAEFDRFWVYAAGLTNVEVHLSVVDTASGEEWRFDNPLGAAFPAVLDSQAFATCGLP